MMYSYSATSRLLPSAGAILVVGEHERPADEVVVEEVEIAAHCPGFNLLHLQKK